MKELRERGRTQISGFQTVEALPGSGAWRQRATTVMLGVRKKGLHLGLTFRTTHLGLRTTHARRGLCELLGGLPESAEDLLSFLIRRRLC